MSVTQRVDEPATEAILHDSARGRRRIWRDEVGRPVRVELADGTVLGVDRDDEGGRIAITGDHGVPLLTLASPVVIPEAIRALGLTTQHAADIDGVHRLTATDPAGTTRTELRERTVRVERDGRVLRIDADDEGRPRRVTTPGYDDLVYRRSDGCWQICLLDGGVLLTVRESDDGTTYRTASQGWTESTSGVGVRWTDGPAESPVAEVALDAAGRVTAHTWQGSRVVRYSRDDKGRLAGWTETPSDLNSPQTFHVRQYTGSDLSGLVTNGVRSVVRTDAGGRIRKLVEPRHTTSYDYDANGRRTARRRGGSETTYGYDALGQLRAVTTAQHSVTYTWDGLGRRIGITIDGVGYLEHRDPTGRLWSVTTTDGDPVCRFIWWNGRVLARCDATAALDETYLTDPLGTMVGVASADTGWQFTDAIQPPFGAVEPGTRWRPTLFGHIADGATGLICFGARDLDPETGSFLTPDPWHGDPDDPRRLAGQPASTLPSETPSAGIHAYALSQHDPLARPDNDGHFGVFNFFLTLVLGPTWGAALTSLSLFLFTPLNVYMEVIGLLGFFGGRHFWPQHSIFGLRGLSGSARLGTAAVALNGFFPRAMAGVNGDRCITIGHVVWESRHFFRMLDRARVLEFDDISGTPAADGTPSLDARRFSDQPQGSILVVTSTDTDRRQRIHASWWTRGPGNAVGMRGVVSTPSWVQTFEDRVSSGTAHARGTVHLAQPIPIDMPTPRAAGDRETLTVDEYAVAGGQLSTADLVPDVWFAFDVDSSDVAATTVLAISASSVPAAHGVVLTVVPGARPVAILDHNLPARFTSAPRVRDSVTLQKLAASSTTSTGWTIRAGATQPNKLQLAAPGHPVAVGDVFRCVPTMPDPTRPERPNAYTAIEAVRLALTVSPTLGASTVTGSTLYRLAPDGAAVNGTHPDPVGHPDQIAFTGEHPFEVNDMVQVVGGAVTGYGVVTTVTAAVPAGPAGPDGAAGTAAVPASITLDEPLTGVPAGPVRVARLKETSRDTDKGGIATQTGDVLTVGVTSTALFAVRQPVLIDGAPRRVRQVSAITMVDVDTVDEVVGTGPFTLTTFTAAGSSTRTKLSSARFVKHTGGDLPSAYGSWPAAIMGLVPDVAPSGTVGYNRHRQPSGWRYFLAATPTPASMHPDFGAYWQPVTVGGASYWLLSEEVKIVKDGSDSFWEPDADDDHPSRYRQQVTPDSAGAFALTLRGFVKTAVTRPEVGGGRVFAYPAEVQVPEEPGVRWSLADSLADHELVHTLQNTWWGPILGAMPLQGAFRTVRDILVANNVNREDIAWMDYHPFADLGLDGFDDSNWFEMVSIGGLMQIIWSFVILGPALINDDARKAILSTNFDDWSSVFNPVNQAIIDAIPRVQDDVETSKDWTVVLGRALTRALDFKAWTPFMGFIKLLLPDSPRNFLEQQASRKSGDLYSTILSVDDKFNAELTMKRDLTDANVSAPLGDAVRLLSHLRGRMSRNQGMDACDAPGSHLVTLTTASVWAATASILQFSPNAPALLPADLYEHVSGPAPTPLQVDGPPVGSAATVTSLWIVPAGTVMRPRLRAIVPLPPRVVRTLGCYLVPGGPAVWSATAPDRFAITAGEDAHTGESTITIVSTVDLGAEPVPWSTPAATGVTPTGPVIARFVTEKQHLSVADRSTTQLRAVAGHGVTLAARTGGLGWDLTVDPPSTTATLPTNVRVRIWALVRPADPDLFDLTHSDVPTLAGKRSYLESDLWIPVRDFLIAVTDLPALPLGGGPATMTANGSFDLDLPIKVAGPASIVPTGALVRVARESDVTPAGSPRGERWRFVAAGDRFVETPQVVPVVVRFAPGVERRFDLRVEPNFTLDAATFDVTPTAPLALSVTGGTGPFTLMNEPPDAARTEVTVAGSTVTVTIAPPPTPAPAGSPLTWQLKVEDSTGAIGVRTLILHP